MSLDSRFANFHATHPEVYVELCRLARLAKTLGKRRLGIKRLWETMRWELDLRCRDDEYQLNNSYTSRYARLIMDQEPDLAGMFETRALKEEREAGYSEEEISAGYDDYYASLR